MRIMIGYIVEYSVKESENGENDYSRNTIVEYFINAHSIDGYDADDGMFGIEQRNDSSLERCDGQ